MQTILYRNEYFGGSGERDAASVLQFEIFELGNYAEAEEIATRYGVGIPEGYDSFMDELCENEQKQLEYVQHLLNSIKNNTGKQIRYVLWLADEFDAWRFWCACEDIKCLEKDFDDCPRRPENWLENTGIDAYDVSNGIYLCCDGDGGLLYGFEEFPSHHMIQKQ